MAKLNSALLFRCYIWLADRMKEESEQVTELYNEQATTLSPMPKLVQ